MPRVSFGALVLIMALGFAGCVDVDALTHPRPQASRYGSDTVPNMTPDLIPAGRVIDKGKETGTYNGATYVCADGGCTMAKRIDGKKTSD